MPHVEKHFTGSESIRDGVIGMTDGLTVPFALFEANNGRFVSVLTAVGSALIGLGPRESTSWSEHGIEP